MSARDLPTRVPGRPRRGRGEPVHPHPQCERPGGALSQAPRPLLHAARHGEERVDAHGNGDELHARPGPRSRSQRHQSKIVVLSGINMQDVGVGAPHTKGLPLVWTASKLLDDQTFTRADGSGGMYYGWNSAPSIDQVISGAIAPPTPYRSLEFGVRSGGSNPASRMVYAGRAEAPRAGDRSVEPVHAPLLRARSTRRPNERLSASALAAAELARDQAARRRGRANQDRRAPRWR